MEEISYSVSEFISIFNQTIDFAYPSVNITGELANFRISKNRWVYFDLKDDQSTLKFFGTIFNLPGPLEEGMLVNVKGQPRLHNLYGFSINVESIRPSGEGSIKKAAELLKIKLAKEGLFDESRKRLINYPPNNIGLITSKQSAAYSDFIKIINERWHGLSINLVDVQVQGDPAEEQIINALELLNVQPIELDAIVVIRGGGSPEDLAVFNSEKLTRAIAGSRIPTLVGIGHENDVSLAELVADKRASTPSNAAQLLVPDKLHLIHDLKNKRELLEDTISEIIENEKILNNNLVKGISDLIENSFKLSDLELNTKRTIIKAYNPQTILNRGYSIVRKKDGLLIKSSSLVKLDEIIKAEFSSGSVLAKVSKVTK